MRILILFLIIILVIVYNYNTKSEYEYFENNNIEIINKDILADIIINDDYLKTFSKYDLIARKIKNISEYYKIISQATCDIKKTQRTILIDAITIADSKCSLINKAWLDGSKLKNIKWRIGFMNNKKYEDGLSHTIQNIIILNISELNNDINVLAKTLLHEKIHIYQKIYPFDIAKYLEYYGYTRFKKRNKIRLIRANPDIDMWTYKNYKNKELIAKYNSSKPKNIRDVKYKPKNKVHYEHPFEKMVYDELNKM
jgi:hypothetical protein